MNKKLYALIDCPINITVTDGDTNVSTGIYGEFNIDKDGRLIIELNDELSIYMLRELYNTYIDEKFHIPELRWKHAEANPDNWIKNK